MSKRKSFSVELDLEHGEAAPVVLVHGEIDMATAIEFERSVAQLLEPRSDRAVIVDLGGVKFIDSKGVSALLRTLDPLRAAGGLAVVVVENENIRTMFEISGLDRALKLCESRAEALAAVQSAA